MSGPRKAPRTATTPSRQPQFSRPVPQSSHVKENEVTPPSIARFRAAFLSQSPPTPPTSQALQSPSSGGKTTSHFGKMTGPIWPLSAVEGSKEPQASERTSSKTQESTGSGDSKSGDTVSWADLLGKIQQTRETNYPSLPAEYRHVGVDSRSHSSAQTLPITRAAQLDESLHDRIFETQAESRRYSLALQEELRELQNPAEALNWLQNRLLDQSNEESLMSKLTSSAGATELHNLYGDLLVDLTHFLRTSTSPQSAFLPLILAKAHSPTSYLYGCTAKLYAANIRAKWEMYGDIQGILELIQDMEKGAVHLNPLIKDYVKNISLAVMADRMRVQRELDQEEAAERTALREVEGNDQEASKSDVTSATFTTTEIHPSKMPKLIKFSNNPKIESKLFFNTSQHRALKEMEKLVVQDQERYFEARAREDNLRDNSVARYGKAALPYNPNNSEANGSQQEEDEESDVNTLIASYGKAIPAYSQRRVSHPASHAPETKRRGARASTPDPFVETMLPIEASQPVPMESSFDVLAEAVSEASQERKSKKKVTSRSQKTYKRSSNKSNAKTEASDSRKTGQKEIVPRLVV